MVCVCVYLCICVCVCVCVCLCVCPEMGTCWLRACLNQMMSALSTSAKSAVLNFLRSRSVTIVMSFHDLFFLFQDHVEYLMVDQILYKSVHSSLFFFPLPQ